MNTYNRTRTETAADLRAGIESTLKQLAESTDAASKAETMKKYIETVSKFHNYSMNNQMLILSQNPNATLCAGYQTWVKMKRNVKKGEKGIAILAPMVVKEIAVNTGKETKALFFKTVYIFDYSQTEGEEIEQPNWKSPEKSQELHDKLTAYCAALNITVVIVKEIDGETQGSSSGGKIQLIESAGTKTFVHELSHEILHHAKGETRPAHEIVELEAEAIAYAVSKHFGIDPEGSPNYIALSSCTGKDIIDRMNRIRETAAAIIEAIEN